MNTYYPIIYNPNANQLQELPQYSELNLADNSVAIGTFYDSNRSEGLIGQYLSVDAGGVVWTSVPPTAQSDGISLFKDGNLVGAAFSFNKLNFTGELVGVTSSSSPLQTGIISFFSYWTRNSSGISTLTGNVGIGSTLPTSKLTVIGDVLISGILTAGNITGVNTAGTAVTATNINISAITSTDTTTSVVLVGNQATGGQQPFIDSGLTYDANANVLTATTFSGQVNAGVATITTLSGTTATYTTGNFTTDNITTANISTLLNATGASTLNGVTVSGITTFTNSTDNTLGNPDTGSVQIDGGLGVNKSVSIDGGLDVDGITELDELNVTGVATFTSIIQPSAGSGNGIEWASNIGGGSGDRAFIRYFSEAGDNTRLLIGLENDTDDDIRFQATTSSFTGDLSIEGTTQSTSKDTGSLIVEGGVGIEKNLFVGGTLAVTGFTTFSGPTTISSVLGISGITTFTNTTDNTLGNPDTGAVQIDGGLGVNKNVSIDGGLDVDGITELDDANISGVATVTTLKVTGVTTTNHLSVSGVTTIGSAVTISSGNINAVGVITANSFVGNGVNLTGIVTQIAAGIGINLSSSQSPGKGVVTINSYYPIGKTIFVTQNGNDTNTGLTENDAKRTIKAAAAIAFPGDTIKVYPGVYVENNPIVLLRSVAVEGTELRNCVITPRYTNRDLFHVNNGCHITDISFIGDPMTDGAAIVALQPLLGVATDRFFDAARMLRLNLDYIAQEAVGFLTSTQYIGAGRTSTTSPVFQVVTGSGIATSSSNCSDDIKDIFKAVCHDITRGGNSRCVAAGKSYFDDNNTLLHITGTDPNGYSVKTATIDTIFYAAQIARAIVNNSTWGGNPVGLASAVTGASYDGTVGIVTITAANHGLSKDDAVKINGLQFTCPGGSGITTTTFPDGTYGSIFNVNSVIDTNNFEVIVGTSTITHTYSSGGTVQKYTNFGHGFTQVKDLSMQKDPDTGFNNGVNGCANVVSAIYSCVGVVTTIVGFGTTAFTTSGIKTTYPGNRGFGFSTTRSITTSSYSNSSGITTLTLSPGYSIKSGDRIELRDLVFSCDSGAGVGTTTQKFPSGKYGYEFYVDEVNDNGTITINVGVSTLAHTYVSGGVMVDRSVAITTAAYANSTGITTVRAPGAVVRVGDLVTLRDLKFSCTSGAGTTTIYPTGNNGYEFKVLSVVGNTFHTATNAAYDPVSGITTITIPSHGFSAGDKIILKDRSLIFTCSSDGNTKEFAYPRLTDPISGKIIPISNVTTNTFTIEAGASPVGQQFAHTFVKSRANGVERVIGEFTVNTGVSTIPHTYVSGGVVLPSYSRGVGPITQGPYIRNCTNFVGDSIGMRIDGFAAEPGDKDDIGVTGTMSVDSFTQYNQGGIGVSITNGAYAQLVSIFTICNDIAIFTASGGQCDITNSNSSFGNYGLYSIGVGNSTTKSIYRSTGVAVTDVAAKNSVIKVSGVGTYRPYDGQVCYFDKLYYFVDTIDVTNGGSGYTIAPRVTVSSPTGPNGISAQATSTIDAFGRVTAINIVNSGTQYLSPPTITIAGPTGVGITATASVSKMQPIYYRVSSATLPDAGISTVSLLQTLNNNVSAGTTVYFSRGSLQLASTISFEHVGAGTNINTAKPALGGVVIPENKVVQLDGGSVTYTSTDQSGNFNIGDGVVINQATGQISGRDFTKALFTTMTPFILALSD